MSTADRSCCLVTESAQAHKDTAAEMWSKKQYLDMVSIFLQAKPPKPHELRPCYQHELLLHAICRPKEPLTKDELTDLVWNMSNGPKKKTSKSRRRQSGGREMQCEPTDAEVIFGGCVKKPLCRCGWERSRIDWLFKLERKAVGQHTRQGQKGGDPAVVKESMEELMKADRDRRKARIKAPGCWALLPFACGWCLGRKSSNCLDVPHRKNSS